MEANPIEIFSKWYDQEINLPKVAIPYFCCLSTIGIENFLNARFVFPPSVLAPFLAAALYQTSSKRKKYRLEVMFVVYWLVCIFER
jgi:hypothetical protein